MTAFQGKINIENGIVKSVSSEPGAVTIVKDGTDLKFPNAWVYPGFSDAHGHISALGSKLSNINLSQAKSQEECAEIALKHDNPSSEWLTAWGWNEELWEDKVSPDASILDEYFSDRLVCFTRIDGHAAWVNSAAMKIAGINKKSKNPEGGIIVKDEKGLPTGLLIDNAMELVKKLLPRSSPEQTKKMIILALEELAGKGISCVHDMDVSPEHIPVFKELEREGKLSLKIYSYIKAQNDEWKQFKVVPYNGKKFHVSGLKFYTDGALGSRGAALFDKYSDSDSKGLFLIGEDELFRKAKAGLENGFHIAVHAIGDAANSLVLKVFKKLYDEKIADKNSVLRVEHAQVIEQKDLKIFSENKIFASVQPVHCISDAQMAEKRLGKRCSNAYLWKTLISIGAELIAGSDFPIEDHNPLSGIDAFIGRVPFGSNEPWYPDERVSREEAIKFYTVSSSGLTSNLKSKKIEKGMSADLTILDKNLLLCPESEIKEANVIATFVDGEPVYINNKQFL
jgi:predicted amidohydrolase YtcJ